jgi:drug/metabolite transporter (DMT)-like permease
MDRYKTYAVLTLVSLSWGGTFIVANLIVQEIPPVLGAFIRFFISGIVLFGVLLLSKEKRTPLKKDDLVRLFILGLTGIFLYNYFFFYGLKITTPINGSLIIAANPATTTLLSALYLKEKITLKQLLGILISFIGVSLVITRGSWAVLAGLNFNHGDLMLLVCMLSWAVFTIVGKEAMRRLSPLETTTYATIIGALLFIPFAWKPLQEVNLLAISIPVWGGLLYMSLIVSVIAFLYFYQALNEIGASQAAIFVNMVPLFTMILSALMGQAVLPLQALGGAMIIFGVAITTNMLFNGGKKLQKQPLHRVSPGA